MKDNQNEEYNACIVTHMHVPMSLPPQTLHLGAFPPAMFQMPYHGPIMSPLTMQYIYSVVISFLGTLSTGLLNCMAIFVEVIVEGQFFPSEICSRAWCALNMPIPPKLIDLTNYFLQLDAKPHALITSPTTFAKASLTHLALYSGPSLIRIAWDQSPFRLVKFSD